MRGKVYPTSDCRVKFRIWENALSQLSEAFDSFDIVFNAWAHKAIRAIKLIGQSQEL